MRLATSARVIPLLLWALAAVLGAAPQRGRVARPPAAELARPIGGMLERVSPMQRARIRAALRISPVPQSRPASPTRRVQARPSLTAPRPSQGPRPGSDYIGEALRRAFGQHATVPSAPLVKAPPAETTVAQTLPEALGLYQGAVDGIAGPLTANAVAAFHRRAGRPFTGGLDLHTREAIGLAALREYGRLDRDAQRLLDGRLREFLARVGFDRGGSLEVSLRKYQRSCGLPERRQVNPEFVSRLERDLSFVAVAGFTRHAPFLGVTPERYLRSTAPEAVGYLSHGRRHYILLDRQGPELWELSDHAEPVLRHRGAAAIERFHEAGRQIAAANSRGDVVFLHAAPQSASPEGPVALQFGSHRADVPRLEFEGFLHGGVIPDRLQAIFASGPASTSTRQSLVVLEGGLFRPPGDTERSLGLARVPATELALALEARLGDRFDVFRDDDPEVATTNLSALRPVSGAADVAVYTAQTIIDFGGHFGPNTELSGILALVPLECGSNELSD